MQWYPLFPSLVIIIRYNKLLFENDISTGGSLTSSFDIFPFVWLNIALFLCLCSYLCWTIAISSFVDRISQNIHMEEFPDHDTGDSVEEITIISDNLLHKNRIFFVLSHWLRCLYFAMFHATLIFGLTTMSLQHLEFLRCAHTKAIVIRWECFFSFQFTHANPPNDRQTELNRIELNHTIHSIIK